MFRLLCCRSRNATRVDEITDSLEKCLTVEQGVEKFKSFLEKNNFELEYQTLLFAMRCQSISTKISRLSPFTRAMGLPAAIQQDIQILYNMAEEINFDSHQMNELKNLSSHDIETKMKTLQNAQDWAVDLLQNIYKTFRKQALETA